MTLMAWLWIGLSILGAIVLAVVVWLAGPLVSIGDVQPFDSALVRLIIILAIVLAVGGAVAWRILSRRRAAAKIAQAMTETVAEDSDAPVLKQKMEDALAVLKRTGKSNARAFYDLPWYLIIGPPGAGKTTALVNSGLKFPLAADNAVMAVQGVGGTRYCDWWFTGERRGGARRRDPQAPRRIARRTKDRLPRLRRLHQDGSCRGLHPIFCRSGRIKTTGGLGRHVPDPGQEGQQRRQGSRGDRPPHSAHLREDA